MHCGCASFPPPASGPETETTRKNFLPEGVAAPSGDQWLAKRSGRSALEPGGQRGGSENGVVHGVVENASGRGEIEMGIGTGHGAQGKPVPNSSGEPGSSPAANRLDIRIGKATKRREGRARVRHPCPGLARAVIDQGGLAPRRGVATPRPVRAWRCGRTERFSRADDRRRDDDRQQHEQRGRCRLPGHGEPSVKPAPSVETGRSGDIRTRTRTVPRSAATHSPYRGVWTGVLRKRRVRSRNERFSLAGESAVREGICRKGAKVQVHPSPPSRFGAKGRRENQGDCRRGGWRADACPTRTTAPSVWP